MFNSASRFLLTLAATFALLLTMWVTAAHAEPLCRKVGDGIIMCEGTPALLQPAPRGTVRRLPRVSTVNLARAERRTYNLAATPRVGVTVVVARLGR